MHCNPQMCLSFFLEFKSTLLRTIETNPVWWVGWLRSIYTQMKNRWTMTRVGGRKKRGQEAPSVSVRTWICIRLHTWLCVEEKRGSPMEGCSIGHSCSRWRKVGGVSFRKSRRWLTAVCAASRVRPSRTNLVRFADVWKAPTQKNRPSRKI